MTLQFGLFDYLIIAVIYALAATALFFGWLWLRRWRSWRLVIVPVALVALIAPWADEVWIAWRFGQLCKDAGVHVYRKVETDGYYDATTTGWSKSEVVTDPRQITDYENSGFRFRERNTSVSGHAPGKISHLEKYPDGTWRITVIDRPMARYHYKHSYQPSPHVYEEPMGWGLEKKEQIVIDTETKEVLGRDTRYRRYPSFVTQLWAKYFGSAVVGCDGPSDEPEKQKRIGLLYRYVLIPKN